MLISNKANISTKKTNKENGANSLMIQEWILQEGIIILNGMYLTPKYMKQKLTETELRGEWE
jgi:hypothetical protein